MRKLFIEDGLLLTDMETALKIGAMNYGFNLDGIIGLDLLQQMRTIINIDELTIQSNY